MRSTVLTCKVPKPRRYDCVNYSNCLEEAAIRNYCGNMCAKCDSYIKIAISDDHIEDVSLSSKQEYIQYEIA